MTDRGDIVIYSTGMGRSEIDVNFRNDTVWLSLEKLSELFDRDKSVISRHIRNIFQEGELSRDATVAFFATVQEEGGRTVQRNIEHFNLDVIISVGYRVKSPQATRFRIWATNVLKEHLVRGYTLNIKRLQSSIQKYDELRDAVALLTGVSGKAAAISQGEMGILQILKDYASALETLDSYDHQRLEIPLSEGRSESTRLTYKEAISEIRKWREAQNAGPLFGNEKDKSFRSSLETIYQTFDGVELYPSLAQKAANLLYFIVKNHSFTDGNKRIAAGLFVYFLSRNNALLRADGSRIIADNALVAITIMVACSDPSEKDIIVKLIANLIS